MTAELESLTNKIQVSVNSEFVTKLTEQGTPLFVFSYTVNIENKSDQAVKLISRYWLITDGEGKEMEVAGDGVIGKQPVIPPKGHYQYSSGCHLNTPFGTMQGHYNMHTQKNDSFRVSIPIFQLAQPYCVN
ncbi:Co2+/Mg2+ efflux protein ApaG [Thalassotalea profundi]|uniref:Protein ApaG n=1 Tax=Thalassotalea profundi TaxID=2036687 RepID=A0ABQ3IR71_9GAMM|nr:Co2+/Mg2+ efflux protein ApaG [Thalassotalea profundi]GHE92065.1 protein ApaG [Thalassotalea profundi]